MQNEQSYWGEEGREKDAGEASLERSERSERSGSEASPAAPPAAGGDSFPVPEGVPGGSASADECAIPAEMSADELTADAAPPAGEDEAWEGPAPWIPNLTARRRGTLARPPERPQPPLTPQQKLLLLDTWLRSGLPARDFGALVNVSRHTLYAWKQRFEQLGPAGLMEQPRGGPRRQPPAGVDQADDPDAQAGPSRLGLPADQRHAASAGPALPASPAAVARVLHEAGYEMQEQPTHPHPPPVRSLRAGQAQPALADRPVHLHAQAAEPPRVPGGLHGRPQPLHHRLRPARQPVGGAGDRGAAGGDRGLRRAGRDPHRQRQPVRHLARQEPVQPRAGEAGHPADRGQAPAAADAGQDRTLLGLAVAGVPGESPCSSTWPTPGSGSACTSTTTTSSARIRGSRAWCRPIASSSAAPEVLKTLKERVAANALELARHGVPKKPFYLTGQLDGKPFSVHREGDRVILQQAGQPREEIDLVPGDPRSGAGARRRLRHCLLSCVPTVRPRRSFNTRPRLGRRARRRSIRTSPSATGRPRRNGRGRMPSPRGRRGRRGCAGRGRR